MSDENTQYGSDFLKTYQKQIEAMKKPILDALKTTFKTQKMLSDFLDSSVQDALKPYSVLCETLSQSYASSLQAEIRSMTKEISLALTNPISEHIRTAMLEKPINSIDVSKILNQSLCNIDYEKIISEATPILNFQYDSNLDNDYVTFDEATAKELDISETIAIPIGNNKVRMKTDQFITILAFVVPMIISIIFFAIERSDSTADTLIAQQQLEATQERNEIEKQRNQLLSDIRNSIDISNSSDAESINKLLDSIDSLQEVLLSLELNHQDSASVHNEVPESTDNMNKSLHTESEN